MGRLAAPFCPMTPPPCSPPTQLLRRVRLAHAGTPERVIRARPGALRRHKAAYPHRGASRPNTARGIHCARAENPRHWRWRDGCHQHRDGCGRAGSRNIAPDGLVTRCSACCARRSKMRGLGQLARLHPRRGWQSSRTAPAAEMGAAPRSGRSRNVTPWLTFSPRGRFELHGICIEKIGSLHLALATA